VNKVALDQIFSEYFGFPCQFLFHQMLYSGRRTKWTQSPPTPPPQKGCTIIFCTNNCGLRFHLCLYCVDRGLVLVQPPLLVNSDVCKEDSETRKTGGLGPDWSVAPHNKKKNDFLILRLLSVLCINALSGEPQNY
jgi:hypothetical protein